MAHTPGPWTFDHNLGCKTIRGIDTEIADTVGLSPEDEDLANALLIARAPELQETADRRLALLVRCRDAIASQAENLIECEYYEEAAQFEDLEKELAEEIGG